MKFKSYLLPLLLLFPLMAQAHVQWFVKQEQMKNVGLPLDMVSFLLTAGVLTCVLVAVLMTRYSSVLPITGKLLSQIPPVDHRIYLTYFMTVICVFLVVVLLQGGFLAPNLILPTSLLSLGIFLQAAIVVCASFSMVLAGAIVWTTTVVTLLVFPSISINYVFELGAIALFMILNGPVVNRVDKWMLSSTPEKLERRWKLSIRILRIGIGLQLVILALTEKLIWPGLGLVFVEMYPFYNFFPALGMESVSNLHFVYFIGICELVLGGMLALGIASRIVLVTLAAAFTTTAAIHGLNEELLGHLPVFAAAVVLLLECVNKPKGRLHGNTR